MGSGYDDHWTGGWDELFPNDEPAEVDGVRLPDHGDVWTAAFDGERDGSGLRLRAECPVSGVLFEKHLSPSREAARLDVRYRFTNLRAKALPYLWKLHPAFAVVPGCRIEIPARTVVLEPAFRGTLEGAPPEFPWPLAPLPGGRFADLRDVPPAGSREVRFFYATELTDGWCAIRYPQGFTAGLAFPAATFSSCWLFASFGGWRDHYVAVLEPATGYPFRLEEAVAQRRAASLGAGKAVETAVSFWVRPD